MKNLFLISCLFSEAILALKIMVLPELSWLWVTFPFWGWLFLASLPILALVITTYLALLFLVLSTFVHFVINYKGVK